MDTSACNSERIRSLVCLEYLRLLRGGDRFEKSKVSRSLDCVNSLEDPELKADVEFILGLVNTHLGRYDEGYRHFVSVKEHYQSIQDSIGQIEALLELGHLFYLNEEYDKSISLLQDVKSKADILSIKRFNCKANVLLSSNYIELQDYSKSKLLIAESLSTASEIEDKYIEVLALFNQLQLSLREKDLAKARVLLSTLRSEIKANDMIGLKNTLRLSEAEFLMVEGDYEKVLSILDKDIPIDNHVLPLALLKKAIKLKVDALYALSEYKSAYDIKAFYEEIWKKTIFKKSLVEAENKLSAINGENAYGEDTNSWFIGIAGGAMLLFFILFLYTNDRFRQKIRLINRLSDRNDILFKQNQDLSAMNSALEDSRKRIEEEAKEREDLFRAASIDIRKKIKQYDKRLTIYSPLHCWTSSRSF